MSDELERITYLIKKTAELRKDIVHAEEFGEPISLELSGREIAAATYALSLAYITEYMNGDHGSRKIMQMISEASASALATHEIDKTINEILGGEPNG